MVVQKIKMLVVVLRMMVCKGCWRLQQEAFLTEKLLKSIVVDPHPVKITTKLQAAEQQYSCPLATYAGGCYVGRNSQSTLSWLA